MTDNVKEVTRLALWLSFWAYFLFVLSSCATTRPLPADLPQLAVHQGSLRPDSLAHLPAYLVPPPAGSTPRQVRQWQRAQARNLARAGHAPQVVKVKHSTVANGSGSTAVSTAKKSSAAAGEAAKSTVVGKAKGPVAAGDGANVVATTKKTFPWWVLLVVAILLGLNRLLRGRWLL
ncbi:hypothetical protein [uncultured Hymenobacter sp.]|uniref:hypothetical protein n=1 Tax=uncultured Hymenobacter sp. TaxID=170016 RepID=UPI0035CC7931